MGRVGCTPYTPLLQSLSRCRWDLNPRPVRLRGVALPTELRHPSNDGVVSRETRESNPGHRDEPEATRVLALSLSPGVYSHPVRCML